MVKEIIEEAVDNLCLDDAEIRSYSGRCMYGKECLAITATESECKEIITEAICNLFYKVEDNEITADEAREHVNTLMNYNEDSMGLGVVFYWPKIKY